MLRNSKVGKFIFLSLFFVLFAGLSNALFAQDDQGGIVTGIELKEENGKKLLVIKGEYTEAMFPNIKLTPEPTDPVDEFTLKVPGAVVDPEKVTELLIQYEEGKPLEKIEIVDEVEEKSEEEVIFIASFKIKSREKIVPKIIQPITKSEIKLDLGGEEKKEEPKKEEPKPAPAPEPKKEEPKKEEPKTEAVSVEKVYRKPSVLRLSILNASGLPKRAFKLSVFLGHLKKQAIEKKLGVKFNIINISNAQTFDFQRTTIFFREHYLKPALYLANLIPGEQRIVKMTNQANRNGVDVEVYLGKDYK